MTIKGQPGTEPTVSQWVHNHPFGGLAQRSGSYLTDFRFTGHEYDDHSTFQFHYMGARYYDDRFGSFTSIDKASQFASGFNYGGNNPVLGRDPDGNLFFLAPLFIASFAYTSAMTAVQMDMSGDWSEWWRIPVHGLVGGLSGYAAQFGHPNVLWQNVSESIGLQVATNAAHAAIDDRKYSSFGLDVAFGGAHGVLTSEHFDNLVTGHGLRSYDSEFRRMVDNATNQLDNIKAMRYLNAKHHIGIPDFRLAGRSTDPKDAGAGMAFKTNANQIVMGGALFDPTTGKVIKDVAAMQLSHEAVHYWQFNGLNAKSYGFASKFYDQSSQSGVTALIEQPAYKEMLDMSAYTHPAGSQIDFYKKMLKQFGGTPGFTGVSRRHTILPMFHLIF